MRGRGWIVLLGVLLIGLVGLNVSLLKLNAHDGRNAEVARDLRIQNAKLRGTVSRLGSSDRAAGGRAQHGPRDADAADGQLPDRAPGATAGAPRRTCARTCRAPTSEQLVSASPEADAELAAPTPSQPIVEDAGGPEAAVGATGAVGRPAPRAPPAPRADRNAGRLGPGREASRGATAPATAASAREGRAAPARRAKRRPSVAPPAPAPRG